MAVLLGSAVAIAVLLAGTAYLGRRRDRVSLVDVTWGLTFVAVSWVGLAVGTAPVARRLLVAALVTGWGGRLAWHIARRARTRHAGAEDPRYVALLGAGPGSGPARHRAAVRRVYLPQGLLAWFVSLPVQAVALADVGSAGGLALGPVGVLALGGYAVGLAFEVVGDAQLAAFTADPAHRGRVMDRGLWAWTRHPNYFGDACVWWGLWLLAAEHWPGVLTVLSPVVMTVLLVRVSGKALLERSMSGRPGYADYVTRTSGFWPRPPRRGRR